MEFRENDVVKDFKHKDKEKIIHYIELLYSEKSELNQINDLTERKKSACRKANITDVKLAESLMNLSDDPLTALIFHYLSSQNSNKYTQLCADQQTLWEMQQEILKPIDGDSKDERLKAVEYKDKVSIRCHDLLRRINQSYSDIYKEEEEIAAAVRTIHSMVSYEQRLKKYRSDVPTN